MDEAHERALNTDALIGFTKTILTRRLDLELIEASTAMDAERLSRFYGGAPEYIIPAARFLRIYRGLFMASFSFSTSLAFAPAALSVSPQHQGSSYSSAHQGCTRGKGKSGAVTQAAE